MLKTCAYITLNSMKGFTLIELLLYITLVSVGLVGIFSFSGTLRNAGLKQEAMQVVQKDSQLIFHRLGISLHAAEDIDESSTTFSTDNCATNNTGPLSFTVGGNTLDVTLNGTQLEVDSGNGGQVIHTNQTQVTQFCVEDRTPASLTETTDIKMTVTVERVNPSNAQQLNVSETYSTTISLRNAN